MFCEFKLSEECDLITIKGINKDSIADAYTTLNENISDIWAICSDDIALLVPTGQICNLLEAIKEIKKTTPHLTTLIRTGIVKLDFVTNKSFDYLNILLLNDNFPKPQLVCASRGKIELILESYDVPQVIEIISAYHQTGSA